MKIGNEIEYYDYNKRYKNLNVEAQGKVKSQKFFPVFLKDKKEEILKPLSKTKPLTTPFFAYSEVFWSRMIHKYFDHSAPIYRLAICQNYSDNVAKYYDKGTIVPSVLKSNQELVNLLEYFRENKDDNVNIDNYVNFCMKFYNYIPIFEAKVFKENHDLGKQLALQYLISVLQGNQNYHYENVSFVYENNKLLRLAPPIDHEFSTMFLYLDNENTNQYYIQEYLNNFILNPLDMNSLSQEERNRIYLYQSFTHINKTLELIVKRYPEVVSDFLQKLEIFIDEFQKEKIEFVENNYIEPFNTENYKIGICLYKNHDQELAEKLCQQIPQIEVNLENISNLVTDNILEVAVSLKENLYSRLEKTKTLEKVRF